MSISLYDKAVLGKIRAWFKNTVYANTAITYNIVYNLIDGESGKGMEFPLINIYRVPGFELAQVQSYAARRRGLDLGEVEDMDLILSGRYMALDLTYQLDFYSKSSEDLYDLILEIIKALVQYPDIIVEHKDPKTEDSFEERYELTFQSGPHEQSEFDNDDRIYRAYITYTIKNARVYDITDYTIIKEVDLDLNIFDRVDAIRGDEVEEIKILIEDGDSS